MRAQPRGRAGTTDRPFSALDLRLALAVFGLVVSAACAVLFFRGGHLLFAALSILLAAIAVVDLLVIQLRRKARRTAQRDTPPQHQ
jgi:hypothetical protein